MGFYYDDIRVAVSLRGSPERLLELVRRSTDAAYFSALEDGVRWPGEDDGEPPWTAVRPGGLELLAASTAAMPAKDAQLAAAIAAHLAELGVEYFGDEIPEWGRDMDYEMLSSYLCSTVDGPVTGAALRTLYAAEHALLLTWQACGLGKSHQCDFGFDANSLGFDLEAYELGGDTLRFSFLRYGWSFGYDGDYWGRYQAIAALFTDPRCTIVVEGHGHHPFTLAVLTDGQPEYIHMYFQKSCNGEGFDDEEDYYRLEELTAPSDDDDWLARAAARDTDAPHRGFSFAKFCSLGAAYEPGVRAALRVFDAPAEQRMCVQRNQYKHAGAVILRAYRRARESHVHLMCRQRVIELAKLYVRSRALMNRVS